ncbi:MAG: SPOR domain-containing protein [Flavobacteriaceae bacterium]|nr:SPOR domain-containing protein [Flavobacteriaceae bacterium]
MLFSTKKINLLSFVFIAFFTFTGFTQQKEGELQIETSAKIDAVVAQKKQYSKKLKYTKGYRIQLFYGSEKGSYEVKNEFKLLFPDIPTKIVFSSPQWKVQVGNFKTRLEADKTLISIKKKYPSAIILATKIDLKK